MCEVKGGCTCGNETCCMDDDFDLTVTPTVNMAVDNTGRRSFYVDVGDLPNDKAAEFISAITAEFKKAP